MGELENDALQPVNLAINSFSIQCRQNLAFLQKFGEYIDNQEKSFDRSWASKESLNNYFFAYEKDVLSDYLLSLNNQNKQGIKGLIERNNTSLMENSKSSQDSLTDL